MIERQLWVDHKFNLGINTGWTQNVMSHIRDTIIRLEYHCQDLTDDQLSLQLNNSWSIKEHIGHLSDLEDLWRRRFLEFPKGDKELVMADMSNQKTKQSNHNNETLDALLGQFIVERENTMAIYNQLDAKSQNHQAMHPRIKMLMRPVDLLFFVAEHDNHHITSIIEIKNAL